MASRIQVNDLRSSWLTSSKVTEIVTRVQRGGWYVLGPENEAFEESFADYLGVKHALGVASGTDALTLAMQAVGCGSGSRVATVANAGGYSSIAARLLGASLAYIEVDAHTLSMDVGSLRETLARGGADFVVVTHLYGSPADIEAVCSTARDFGVPLIEDCAQAIGASRSGRRLGSWGDVAAFSFYPTKNLGAVGDGGAVVTMNTEVAQRVRRLRQYGWSSKYQVSLSLGRNSRLDEVNAAVVRAGLALVDEWNARRRRILRMYEAAVTPAFRFITDSGPDSAVHLAVLDVRTEEERKRWRQHLDYRGIETDIHYPIPDHLQVGFSGDQFVLPVTEQMSKRVLTLPCYPSLSDALVEEVAAELSWLAQSSDMEEAGGL